MKKYVVVLFLCFFSLMTFAQNTNTTLKLDYLPEYPSEIDGACCGYYLSQEDLKNDKLLIADDFISAYMIINGKKEVLSIKHSGVPINSRTVPKLYQRPMVENDWKNPIYKNDRR